MRGFEVSRGRFAERPWFARRGDEGAAGVFALTTPFESGVEAEVRQGRAILSAAAEVRVPHLVFSSVAGADQESGVPHFDSKARIEAELVSGDVPFTILGPTYFFDNALGGAERILGGVLDLPLPADRALQQLARPDLGAFATEVLLQPELYVGQRIELASDAPTPVQMASALSAALGREVLHRSVPLAAVGNPDMRAMWTFLNGPGYRVDIPTLHASRPEVSWTSFADWGHRTWATAR